MALGYLLDTNVVSELAKALPNPGVAASWERHESVCAIGAPTLEELVFGSASLVAGVRQSWLQSWISGLVDRVAVLPYDAQAALWLGAERARLKGLGKPPPRTDGEIAAIAVRHGLVLVTHNVKDFANFSGLLVEDWHTP